MEGLGYKYPNLTSPISQGNIRLNFEITTKSKLEEPNKFKGWVLGTFM